MLTVFFLGQAAVASGVALCVWLMWREYRERLREREERRVLQLTIRAMGLAWESVELGSLDIDEFCTTARRAHLAFVEGREPASAN